jgi:hypothetical protein
MIKSNLTYSYTFILLNLLFNLVFILYRLNFVEISVFKISLVIFSFCVLCVLYVLIVLCCAACTTF